MHLESVKLLVDEFARLVLPLGTTAVVADPHEIANVLGSDGVHWLHDASAGLQLEVFFMAPSCVPASIFESPRRPLALGDLEALMRRRRVLGLAEMMNFPGVIAGDPTELAKLELEGAQHVDGHAPGVLGPSLQAYAAAGIRSDHEALTVEEGRERLRAGMWLLIREASMARNLHALLPLVAEYGPGRIAFCTDDRDPDDIADNGHVNGMVRDAVAAGIDPADALLMAGSTPRSGTACGTTARSRPATSPTCWCCRISSGSSRTRAEARPADRRTARAEVPEWVRQTVRIKPVTAADFAIAADGGAARAIGLVEDQVVTESLLREPLVVDGHVVSDPERDLVKLAVVERHLGTGRIGLGLVVGLGARSRRACVDGRPRRAQPRRRRRERRRHGVRDRPPRRDRRRDRRGGGRTGRRGMPASGRRAALGSAPRRRRRPEPRDQRGGARRSAGEARRRSSRSRSSRCR